MAEIAALQKKTVAAQEMIEEHMDQLVHISKMCSEHPGLPGEKIRNRGGQSESPID